MKVSVIVNGATVEADVEDRTLLVHFLRETAGLTATNIGCDTTSCGACTVLLDGESVKSCTVLAAQGDGRQVTTVEGLAGPGGELHPMQRAFRAEHGLQCGFCTPGMVMASVSLLRENPHPTESEVRAGLEGNLCRCTGYHNIVRAVLAASEMPPPPRRAGPMIPAPFTYHRAGSVAEALDLAADHGDDAKFLAGGHSLLPLMKLRLAMPEVLIDLGSLRELSYVREEDGYIAIGALTRHHDLEHSGLLARAVPLLAHAAGQVGDPQVRHRGTIGGSLAHSDPASDLPATVLALDATLVARGPSGTREIAAADFFQGLFETALEPDELLTEIQVPVPAPGSAGWSFQKFTKRAIDWAIVGVAVQGTAVALVNMAGTPVRATGVERALAAGATPAQAAAHAAEGTAPGDDINASPAYREHLARVLVERALVEAQLPEARSAASP